MGHPLEAYSGLISNALSKASPHRFTMSYIIYICMPNLKIYMNTVKESFSFSSSEIGAG